MLEDGLSPFIPTLLGDLEAAVRAVLGLKPNVGVRCDISSRRHQRQVPFRLSLPNGVELGMSLVDVTDSRSCWRVVDGLGLATHDDPKKAPESMRSRCIDAVGQHFRRQQSHDEGASAEQLWAEWDRLTPWRGLRDDDYRRLFTGPQGPIGSIRLGFRCNQNCGLCWQSRTWPDVPRDMQMTWLDELAALGASQITFSGGEPLIHTSLTELVHRAKRVHGMRTMVQTNAVMVRRKAVLKRIVAGDIDRLFVSLHAADAATSDRITRAPGTWVGTIAGIEAALQAGVRVGINCVIDRENVDVVEEHARFIVERFVKPFPNCPVEAVTYSRPQPYYDQQLWQDSIVPMDRVEPGLIRAVSMLDAAGVVVDVTTGSCALPACLLRDTPHLIYLPAEDDVGGADPAFRAHGHTAEACGRCALSHRCQGPGDGYVAAFGDRGLVPFAEVPRLGGAFPLSL